jgi:hypothetical protein
METVHTTIPALEMAVANRKAREGLLYQTASPKGFHCLKVRLPLNQHAEQLGQYFPAIFD